MVSNELVIPFLWTLGYVTICLLLGGVTFFIITCLYSNEGE